MPLNSLTLSRNELNQGRPSLTVGEQRVILGDYPVNYSLPGLPPRIPAVARRNRYGQFDIGGPIGAGDIKNAMAADDQAQIAANVAMDIMPVVESVRSIERLPAQWQAYQDAESPIQKALRAAEMSLEGGALVSDILPPLKAAGVAASSLIPLMMRRNDELDAMAKFGWRERGAIGSKADEYPEIMEGAVSPEGMLNIFHYSHKPLKTVDPAMNFTGASGRTLADLNRRSDPNYVNRSYWGLETKNNPYKRESMLGRVKNRAVVDPKTIYNPHENPQKLWVPGDETASELRIKEAGYKGYIVNHPRFGTIVQTFDEVPTRDPSYIDYTHWELEDVPAVPQFDIPRYQPTKRPKSLNRKLTPTTAIRLIEHAEEGIKRGGKEWYNTTPLREAYIYILGAEEGEKEFRRFIKMFVGSSGGAKMPENVRRASMLAMMERQGVRIADLSNVDMPAGYGHIYHNTHVGAIEKANQAGGLFDSVDMPKYGSFQQNLHGNYRPVTGDRHNARSIFNDLNKTGYSKTEYPFVEQYQQELAERIGVTGAQFQSSVWIGDPAGPLDRRPFMDVMKSSIKRTAEKTGRTPHEVTLDFIEGRAPLWGLAALLGGNLLFWEDDNFPESTSQM